MLYFSHIDIPNCFYRVSIKALILDETRTKFLIVKEENGKWELPGGCLDWGATPLEDLHREIREETGLKITQVADHPSYFLTFQNQDKTAWLANVIYETVLENLDFTPSDECVELISVDANGLKALEKVSPNVQKLAEMFDPQNHTKQ